MTRAIITQLVDALEVGWSPRFTGKDARALSDAAITAAREYLATEPTPTLTEALTQQGIKLRTEFEPKQRDHIEDSLGMAGERARRKAARESHCYQGEYEDTCKYGDTDCPAQRNSEPKPSGERAELIARLAKQWAELDPVDPYRADVGQAVSMLEADAQQAKRVPMTDGEIAEISERMEASDPTDSFWREFARAIEAHHGITGPSEKPTDWSAA